MNFKVYINYFVGRLGERTIDTPGEHGLNPGRVEGQIEDSSIHLTPLAALSSGTSLELEKFEEFQRITRIEEMRGALN